MLLLPLTPPLIYLKLKKIKGPKMDSLFTSLSLHKHSLRSLSGSGGGGRRREEMASSLTIKESFKVNAARARLARGFRNKKISREISCKKFKTHLQFYVKISNKNFSSFFTGKSLYNFSKKLLLRPFFKNSLQEGVFENSLKFLQLLQNLTPIRKLFCTFLY